MSNISLNDAEKDVLGKHYRAQLSELHSRKSNLEKEIEQVEGRLLELGFDNIDDAVIRSIELSIGGVVISRYQADWTIARKAEFILAEDKQILSPREIADRISEMEGGHFTGYRINDLTDKIAATLKQKVDKKETFTRMSRYGQYHYGLLEWLNSKGRMPSDYLSGSNIPAGMG